MARKNRVLEIINELKTKGSIDLGSCSKSTAESYKRKCNDYLKENDYTWRVILCNTIKVDGTYYELNTISVENIQEN